MAANPRPERLPTADERWLECEGILYEPTVFPFPAKAPKVEKTTFKFNKVKDATGSILGDILKRGSFYLCDLVGDKRREILRLLPVTQETKSRVNNLNHQLVGLEAKLLKQLAKLSEVVPTEGHLPAHFDQHPDLED